MRAVWHLEFTFHCQWCMSVSSSFFFAGSFSSSPLFDLEFGLRPFSILPLKLRFLQTRHRGDTNLQKVVLRVSEPRCFWVNWTKIVRVGFIFAILSLLSFDF